MGIKFVSSNGWVNMMKRRARLVCKAVKCESKSGDLQETEEWGEFYIILLNNRHFQI